MSHASSKPWTGQLITAVPPVTPIDPSRREPPASEPSGRQAVVLIATGRLQVRAVGTTVLGGAGFRVEAATSGKAVLADVENLRPDLILTEAVLDDMDASRLCSQVRALTAGRTIPILVMSDFSDPRDVQQILTQDLTDVVSAPVNWKVLTFRIHRWISMAKRFRSLDDQDLDFEEVRESALKASTELLQLRNYDSLTGLPNREMFVNSLELVMAQGQRATSYCAVLYLDIDDFQGVNDLIGRSLGDELLRLVARRLQGCLREGDDLVSQMGDEGSLVSFARVNADQFAILLSSVPNQKAAGAVARRLLASLAEPLHIRDREFRLTARVGIADSLNIEAEGEEVLLQRAEIAMRYCKQNESNNCAIFESFMNDLVVQKLELKAELRKALERQELFLCYQLLVDARTGFPNGVEGLVRWNHPVRGLVPPNDFLPVAEESDLIVEVDRWVLREGCRQGKEWLDKGFPPLLMSLNVSMRFLGEEDFAQQVLAIVEQTGMPPESLQLELSERGNLPDAGRIMSQFEMLVAKGISLALDDFGTGQTSLSYLRTLPISCVKVDQSFVRRIPDDSASVAIVTAIVAMSHHLGLKVVAEGVETTEHWRFLSEHGYDQLQGYLFARPERVEEVETGFRHLAGWRRMMAAVSPQAEAGQPPSAAAPATVRPAMARREEAPGEVTPEGGSRNKPVPAGAEGGSGEWRGSEADLLQLARNDFLTKLYNRFSFDERLEYAVAHADRFGHKIALLLIDLDDFKYVNDTHGHAVGDALLIQIADRLKKFVRKVDTLARIGGDEFAVILSEFNDVKHVAELGSRLLKVLEQMVMVEGRELRVSGSLGISVYPAGSTQAKDLLRQADLALYKAKKHGGNSVRFFAREMDWEVKRRLALAQDLDGAVGRGELFLEYQLQVALATGQVVGVEALLRWDHPAKGLIGPGRLIPIAESTGEIRAIGRWVISSACAQAKAWRQACGRDVPVSVNLSPVQCRDPRFVDGVLEALKEHHLAPELLHLELNERLLTQLPEELEASLKRLGALGVSLTLDNFGTGTSALEHFQRFRFNRLKIHHSLVRTIGQHSISSAVLSGIFALARKMGVQIVAEGVEKPEEVEALIAEGCEIGQGFLFSKPLAADALAELLHDPEGLAGGLASAHRPSARMEGVEATADPPPGGAVSVAPQRRAGDVPTASAQGQEGDVASVPLRRDGAPADGTLEAVEAEAAAAGGGRDEGSGVGLAERLASLAAEPEELPAEAAITELRKLDSYTARAGSAAARSWRRRLGVAAAVAALAIPAFYFLPAKSVVSGAFPQQEAFVEPRRAVDPPGSEKTAVDTRPPRVPAASSIADASPVLDLEEADLPALALPPPALPPPALPASAAGPDPESGRGTVDSRDVADAGGEQATGLEQPLIDFARAWARAWSEQRVEDYLGLYATDFRPAGELGRGEWEEQRRSRILRPRRIEVELSAFEAAPISAERAQIAFEQSYASDSYSDSVRKTFELIREGGAWKILAERLDG